APARTRPHHLNEDHETSRMVTEKDSVLFTVPNRLGVAWCVTQLTAVKAITTEVHTTAPTA
ncbi:hypothetical protein, partial [Streptomyces sp. M2CJ-2]|uniref:hypothetical protein n=1 Tax=Streptomyces sp. M2CJ-2 TaxID=2803948 RepID=UPI001F3D9282